MKLKSITLTAQELLDSGFWEEFCAVRGWNVYAINEGLIDMDENIHLSEEELKQLGITVIITRG